MRIALASARMVNRDIKYNLLQIEHYMVDAQKEDAEFACFGLTLFTRIRRSFVVL